MNLTLDRSDSAGIGSQLAVILTLKSPPVLSSHLKGKCFKINTRYKRLDIKERIWVWHKDFAETRAVIRHFVFFKLTHSLREIESGETHL